MTKDRKAKDAARALKSSEDTPYVLARRLEADARGPHNNGDDKAVPGGSGGVGAEYAPGPDISEWDDFDPPSAEELLLGAVEGWAESQVNEPVDHVGAPGGLALGIDLPSGMSDPFVQEIVVHPTSLDVQVHEEFDGGTLGCNVTAEADVVIEGMMSKAEAISAETAGEVKFVDFDFTEHTASVALTAWIEATFIAIVTPESEMVDDVIFEGAVQLGPN
jgi:hypothetical protein